MKQLTSRCPYACRPPPFHLCRVQGWLRLRSALDTPHHAPHDPPCLRAVPGWLHLRPQRVGPAAPEAQRWGPEAEGPPQPQGRGPRGHLRGMPLWQQQRREDCVRVILDTFSVSSSGRRFRGLDSILCGLFQGVVWLGFRRVTCSTSATGRTLPDFLGCVCVGVCVQIY